MGTVGVRLGPRTDVDQLLVVWRGLSTSMSVFATGIFGVHPKIAWTIAPVLHKGFLHFLGNLAGLLLLGLPIEDHWSKSRYIAFILITRYVSTGIGGLLLANSTEQQVVFYGTSGVVYALAGFSVVHLPAKHSSLNPAEQVSVIVGIAAVSTLLVDFVTGPYLTSRWMNGRHLSGFVFGMGAALYELSGCSN